MYTSSIINKYGDTSNVKTDVKTLNEILGRQGTDLLIDVLAEHAGHVCNKFKLNDSERSKARATLVQALNEAINERI